MNSVKALVFGEISLLLGFVYVLSQIPEATLTKVGRHDLFDTWIPYVSKGILATSLLTCAILLALVASQRISSGILAKIADLWAFPRTAPQECYISTVQFASYAFGTLLSTYVFLSTSFVAIPVITLILAESPFYRGWFVSRNKSNSAWQLPNNTFGVGDYNYSDDMSLLKVLCNKFWHTIVAASYGSISDSPVVIIWILDRLKYSYNVTCILVSPVTQYLMRGSFFAAIIAMIFTAPFLYFASNRVLLNFSDALRINSLALQLALTIAGATTGFLFSDALYPMIMIVNDHYFRILNTTPLIMSSVHVNHATSTAMGVLVGSISCLMAAFILIDIPSATLPGTKSLSKTLSPSELHISPVRKIPSPYRSRELIISESMDLSESQYSDPFTAHRSSSPIHGNIR